MAIAVRDRIVFRSAAEWPEHVSAVEEANFLADLAEHVLRTSDTASPVRAAGVALAALVGPEGVVATWPNRPHWTGLPIRELLEDRLAMPIALADDANAAALGEWSVGAGAGCTDVAVITVGTGIGAGLILGSRLERGANGRAGELGHVVVLPDGPRCACGKSGCLQAVASGRALEQAALPAHRMSAAQIGAAADAGSAWAQKLVAVSGTWLGIAAANMATVLDVQAVVVTGGMSELEGGWWQAVVESFETALGPDEELGAAQRPRILRGHFPQDAGLLGVAMLARDTSAATPRHAVAAR